MPDGVADNYPPISALNDLLYCERRCALHRLEEVWIENPHTLSGTFAHRRADKPVTWRTANGTQEVHGMWVWSDRLRLVGKADVVEFRSDGDSSLTAIPYPVEYKRGKRRKWSNDDVQLCAQALCLEEMLGVPVPRGAIFNIRSKRRREVVFSSTLRELTEQTAARLHALIDTGVTPLPTPKPQCQGCSLIDVCLPQTLSQPAEVAAYHRALFSTPGDPSA